MSSCEKGLKRKRHEELTTRSQEETTDKQKIKISFNSKDSKRYFFTKSEECKKNKETHIAAVGKKRKRKSGGKEVDMHGARRDDGKSESRSRRQQQQQELTSERKGGETENNIIHCSAKKHEVDEFE